VLRYTVSHTASGKRRRAETLYRVARKSADLLRILLVTATAMLAICLLALVGTTNTADAEDSLRHNGKIAFSSNRHGDYEIYTVNPDGSGPRQLTNNIYTAYQPVWSPDGTKLAVGGGHIHVMDADGSDLKLLTANRSEYFNAGPTWSPDGTEIAFTYQVDGTEEVYVMNADGSEPTNLTSDPARDLGPSWSPDGTRITFTSDRNGDFEIYTMDSDGSDVTQVTNNSGVKDIDADWQPLPGFTSPKDVADSDVAEATKDPGVDGGDPDRHTQHEPTEAKPEKQQVERQQQQQQRQQHPQHSSKSRSMAGRSMAVHPPDTGGTSLILVASALFFSGGSLLYTVVRRRM
jgi:dipeptidyl aminopeptidase/acylaminoacyl peptidase